MENILARHRNLIILVAVLFAQVLALAVQVRRPQDSGVRLIRVWAVSTVTPFEKAIVTSGRYIRGTWGNYLYLRNVRSENQALRDQIAAMRMEQVRIAEDAAQARRLQAMLQFKESFISSTVAAQVIGTSGSQQSRAVYIDKGARDGIKNDMAVITPDGIVGKVKDVFPSTALVLLINDQSSGVGAILEKSRLQGILKGTPLGGTVLAYIMSDEKVEIGERVLTSGGDRIFPKGMPIGAVTLVGPGRDLFLTVRVKPAAHLSRIEEVLVITKVQEKAPDPREVGPVRASDILAERLPSVPPKPETPAPGAKPGPATAAGTPPAAGAPAIGKPPDTKPATATSVQQASKPAAATGAVKPQSGTVVPQPPATPGKPQQGPAPKPPGVAESKPANAENLPPARNTTAKPVAENGTQKPGRAAGVQQTSKPAAATAVAKPQSGTSAPTPPAPASKPQNPPKPQPSVESKPATAGSGAPQKKAAAKPVAETAPAKPGQPAEDTPRQP